MSRTAAAASAQRFWMNLGPTPHRRGPSNRLRWTPPHKWEGVAGHSMAGAKAASCCSRSGMRCLLDPDLEPCQRPGESRLHLAFRDAQGDGRFLDAQLQEVAAYSDQPI